MKHISITEYMLPVKGQEMNAILMKYGVNPAQDEHDLLNKLGRLVKDKPEIANDLISIHPDYDMIVEHYESRKPVEIKEKISGCDGSTCRCGGKCSGCSGFSGIKEGIYSQGKFHEVSNATGAVNSSGLEKGVLVALAIAGVWGVYHLIKG